MQLHPFAAPAVVLAVLLALAMTAAVCAGCAADSDDAADQAGSADSAAESPDATVDTDEIDWSSGTHHAVLTFEDSDGEVEIAVYADEAPESAEAFCRLVEEGYYDGLELWLVLPGLYARIGDDGSDGEEDVEGEFAEAVEEEDAGEDAYDESSYAGETSEGESYDTGSAGEDDANAADSDTADSDADAEDAGDGDSKRVVSTMSLTKGTVALARSTEDETLSDAASFIVFLSDMSYLDGQYAAFARVTSGLDTLESFADRAMTRAELKTQKGQKKAGKLDDPVIVMRADGTILKRDRPVIDTVRMVD